MNSLESAYHSWVEQKNLYLNQIKEVIEDLSKPFQCIVSPDFDTRKQELIQFLKYDYTFDEEDHFIEVYVKYIGGKINKSLMEMTNYLIEELGGNPKFWQNKLLDIAVNTTYHPSLMIWQINKAYDQYTGLPPEYLYNIRKKKSIAKKYLETLSDICKKIQKSKPVAEDLLKIDDAYKKLKSMEEKYISYKECVEGYESKSNRVSLKGRQEAKNSLFLFIKKNRQQKINTLDKYNFFTKKPKKKYQSKLLKGTQYEEFDDLFKKIAPQYRKNNLNEESCTIRNENPMKICIEQLRTQFNRFLNGDKVEIEKDKHYEDQNTFIWNKEFYFSYCGFPVKYQHPFDFTQPFTLYPDIIYEIDSQQQFDELNAEDVSGEDDSSSQQSSESEGSFLVDDDYESDVEKDIVFRKKNLIENGQWSKSNQQLQSQYKIIPLFKNQQLPLSLEENLQNFSSQFLDSLEGKGRNQIMGLFQQQNKNISKSRVDNILKNNFTKIKNKSKQIVYTLKKSTQEPPQIIEISDPQTTAENYSISISYATRQRKTSTTQQPRIETRSRSKSKQKQLNLPNKRESVVSQKSMSKNNNNDTILQEASKESNNT